MPLLSQTQTTSYGFDAASNLTRKTDTSLSEPERSTDYRYDALNRLSEELGNSATLGAKQLSANTTTHYLVVQA
jgi:hypothetical protein